MSAMGPFFLIESIELLLCDIKVEEGTCGVNKLAFLNIFVCKKADAVQI